MATKTMRGRCPNCCPNGGACFERTWDIHGNPSKRCQNCGREFKQRTVKASGKPTASQQAVIDHVVEVFGGTAKVRMLSPTSRVVWLEVQNDARHWAYQGNTVYGSIGPNGKFKLKLHRLLSDAEITDYIGINVHLR